MSEEAKQAVESKEETQVEEPVDLTKLDMEQLAEVVEKTGEQEDQAIQDVAQKLFERKPDEKKESQEEQKEQIKPDEKPDASVEQKQVDTAPGYLKETPYKTNEELAKGYVNMQGLLSKQGEELGRLRKPQADEPVQPGLTQGQPPEQRVKPVALEEDYDQGNVANYINQNLKTMVTDAIKPILDNVNQINQTTLNTAAATKENHFRQEAQSLAEKYPEYQIQGDLDTLLQTITTARSQSVDPSTINPECGKVEAVKNLVGMVQRSGGEFKTLEDAHKWNKVKGTGLDQLLLDKQKDTVIDTVKHIEGKQTGAETIAKAGGKVVQKTLGTVTDNELRKLVDAVDDTV